MSVAQKLRTLSRESLVLWRQVLDRPVEMPYWEARSKPVQDLVGAELIFIRPGDDNQTYTADLGVGYECLRFNDLQRSLLIKLSSGRPLPMKEYLAWANVKGIGTRLEFMRELTLISVIEATNTPNGVIFKLK